jgi:hypothetical protein
VSCLSACVGPVPSHVYVCFCTRTIRNSTCAAVGDEGIDTATCVLVGGDVAARGRGGDAEARGCLRSAGTTTFCIPLGIASQMESGDVDHGLSLPSATRSFCSHAPSLLASARACTAASTSGYAFDTSLLSCITIQHLGLMQGCRLNKGCVAPESLNCSAYLEPSGLNEAWPLAPLLPPHAYVCKALDGQQTDEHGVKRKLLL